MNTYYRIKMESLWIQMKDIQELLPYYREPGSEQLAKESSIPYFPLSLLFTVFIFIIESYLVKPIISIVVINVFSYYYCLLVIMNIAIANYYFHYYYNYQDRRQLGRFSDKNCKLPVELKDHVKDETFNKSVAYGKDKFSFKIIEVLFSSNFFKTWR